MFAKNYLLLILLIICYFKICMPCKDDIRCSVSRIHGMRSANCFDMKIRKFPKCIGSNVEVIDLQMNRIRKLNKEDLEVYSNVKILYLGDNMLTRIDENVFSDMTSLQTLDLSMNPLSNLPKTIFQLPSLKNLYINQMLNMNIAEAIDNVKQITSPLQHLDISQNDLESFPKLGIIPTLTKLNVSGNDENEVLLTFNHIAGLCNLKIFDTNNITVVFKDDCDCVNINRWLQYREITYKPFKCYIRAEECPYVVEDIDIFNMCQETYQAAIQQSRFLKIGVPILSILLVALIIMLIWFMRRRRIKKKSCYDDAVATII